MVLPQAGPEMPEGDPQRSRFDQDVIAAFAGKIEFSLIKAVTEVPSRCALLPMSALEDAYHHDVFDIRKSGMATFYHRAA